MASLVCIVCGRGDATVKCSDDEDNFNHFKQCLNDRVKYGELKYAKLAEQIEEVDDWKTVAYHKECRKLIVHSVNIERLRKRSFMLSDDNGLHTNPKKGRPGNYSDKRKNRVLEELHPQNCIFSHCAFCPKTINDTHQVLTENKGSSLLEIKINTYDDDIRVALSDLFEAGDAVAKKKGIIGIVVGPQNVQPIVISMHQRIGVCLTFVTQKSHCLLKKQSPSPAM